MNDASRPTDPAPPPDAGTRAAASEARVALSVEAVRAMIGWQLQQMPQQMRRWLAERKDGTERVVAHMIVEQMLRRGVRFDIPERDPHGSHCGYAHHPPR